MSLTHVCKRLAASGNRVQGQRTYTADADICVLKKRALFPANLARRVIGSKGTVFVFHQQSTLPALLISYLLARLLGRGHGFVYDMHDLAQPNPWSSPRERWIIRLYTALEYLIARLNIQVLTVSKGLQAVFQSRYRGSASVVYSLGLNQPLRAEHSESRSGVVYFGQIKQERIPLEHIDMLQKAGLTLDIHGVFPGEVAQCWRERLQRAVAASGGAVHGPYTPDNMAFLAEYRFSLLTFHVARENIRFCMPNKLFQSLSLGLICVVSDEMTEILDTFRASGAVVPLSTFGRGAEAQVDWRETDKIIHRLATDSRQNFLGAVYASRGGS